MAKMQVGYIVKIDVPEGTTMAGGNAPRHIEIPLPPMDAAKAQEKGERLAANMANGFYPQDTVLNVTVESVS